MKNTMQLDVEQFMKACDQETFRYPTLPDEDVRKLRQDLLIEELFGSGELLESMFNKDIVGIADGIADMLYVLIGTASAYGLNIHYIFQEVHRSNMTKVGPDGTVIRREDGKILKPDTFSPADLRSVIMRLNERPVGSITDGGSL